jgi:hypothetical protein
MIGQNDASAFAPAGVALLAGIGLAVGGTRAALRTRYRVSSAEGGGYAIVDTATGESSEEYGETWTRKQDAQAAADRMVSVLQGYMA